MQVNIHDAKTQLSQLIEKAVNGEEVAIAKAGKPMVKLATVQAKDKRGKPIFGGLEGNLREVYPDWWKPMSDEEAKEFLGL